ncbi:MAG: arsenite methyltransferase [Candidatus Nanopelagicales bacterium]
MTVQDDDIRQAVRERYSEAARSATGCCGPAAGPVAVQIGTNSPFGQSQYDAQSRESLPVEALTASLGCGNPTALAELSAGDVVLDLGSGGGIDVMLSARRVAPGGMAYGLDMTPEMLEIAQANKVRAGVDNVEFLLGSIEDIPLPDASVDVIISNCVVNLSPDKDRVFRESFRVLAPGGRFAISDMVLARPLPPELAHVVGLWTGCIAGALTEDQVVAGLMNAGFEDISVEPTNVLRRADLSALASSLDPRQLPQGLDLAAAIESMDSVVRSAFIRARKPASA